MNEMKESKNCPRTPDASEGASRTKAQVPLPPDESSAAAAAATSAPTAPAPAAATGAPTMPAPAAAADAPTTPAAPAPLPALPLAERFERFAAISLAFGLFYTFCFYKNPHSVTWPLFTAVGYWLLCTLFKELGTPIKKDSLFLVGAAFLVSLSMPMTASGILHAFNRLALFLLLAIFLIHQLCEDRLWNIGKYMTAIAAYTCRTVGSFPLPFRHAAKYSASENSGKWRNLLLAAAGFCASIPLLCLLLLLLGNADAIFDDLLTRLFQDFLNLRTIFGVAFQILASAVLFYCVLCSRYANAVSGEIKNRRTRNPLIAMSFLSAITVFYLLFCSIQVYYLFLRQGTLPESMTYAQYARQGFFQLVFVILVNLVLVLGCLKYFKSSRGLKLMLAVISGCTCIMIASAAYRMVLYVSCYRLTFLRLLVLWFLAMTAALMPGVFRLIFKETFPLFRYCVAIVSVFYICFALARPDSIIARYNLSSPESMNEKDFRYLNQLSLDAAPMLAEYLPDEVIVWNGMQSRDRFLSGFCHSKTIYELTDPDSAVLPLRRYNFSVSEAIKLQEAADSRLTSRSSP